MALNPANFSDVVIQACNEAGANGSTSWVDQSTHAATLTRCHNTVAWSNTQHLPIQATATYFDGNITTQYDRSQLSAGKGGSALYSTGSGDVCVEQVFWLDHYIDNLGSIGVPFALGVGSTVANCLQIMLQDLSGYSSLPTGIRIYLASTINNWDIAGPDATGAGGSVQDFFSDYVVSPQTWTYVKYTRVSGVHKIRVGSVASGNATVQGTYATFTCNIALTDITTISDSNVYALNIGGDGDAGGAVFVGYIAGTRVTKGASVAAMDMDGIPTLPFSNGEQPIYVPWMTA